MERIVSDVRAHFFPQLLYARYDANAAKFPGDRLLRDPRGIRMQFPGGEPTPPISPWRSDTADRRAWMDRNGLDQQLAGGGLHRFAHDLPSSERLAWSRFRNEW